MNEVSKIQKINLLTVGIKQIVKAMKAVKVD